MGTNPLIHIYKWALEIAVYILSYFRRKKKRKKRKRAALLIQIGEAKLFILQRPLQPNFYPFFYKNGDEMNPKAAIVVVLEAAGDIYF